MKAKPIYEVTGNFDVSKAIIIKAKLIKKLGNDFQNQYDISEYLSHLETV